MTNYEAITKDRRTLSDFIFNLVSHCDERCSDCVLKPSSLDYTPKGFEEWLDQEKDFSFPKQEKDTEVNMEDYEHDKWYTFDDLIQTIKEKKEEKTMTFDELIEKTLKDRMDAEDEDEYEEADEEDPRAIVGSVKIEINKTGYGVYSTIEFEGDMRTFELVGILEDIKHDLLGHNED